jgi:amino acid transporter
VEPLRRSAAVDGLWPKAFARLPPKWNTPYISTLALAVLSTFLLVIYQLGDTMRVDEYRRRA